ncbi:MAG TPA: TonB-dependent receptor [Bryobacteraceae bacterium]|nr:TonB-dependent receptor [Bryobacteraceae bacterium]
MVGVVRDASGGMVGSAQVEARNVATGVARVRSTDLSGAYSFLALPAGGYRIFVLKKGFAPIQRGGIVLRVGDRIALDFELALGDSSQAVEVTAEAPLLHTSRGTAAFVVEQKKVVTLPLDGRNFVPLIALAPGVNLPPGNLLPRINGSRPRVSEYIYDGISVLQPEPGQVAFYPVIDAIDEFRVETNSYAAEYGRSNGGVILVSQKSGSNTLHGSLFEFFRNEKLNARNLFATSGEKPRFRRNQYGFVLGGPVRRNVTFFFGDWQGTRLNTGVVRTSTVPTNAQRLGVFRVPVFDPSSGTRVPFPDNTIPASRFDRAAVAVLDLYPEPNVSTSPIANNYHRVGTDNTVANQLDGRLEHYVGSKQRLFGRYSFLHDAANSTLPLPGGSSGVVTRADSVAGEHNWTVSPTSVNLLRAGYTRRGFLRESMRTGRRVSETVLIPNLPLTSFEDVLPTYDIVGLQPLGPAANGNARFTTSVTQVVDHYSRALGGHHLKAGADIRFERLDVLQPPNPTGNFQFTSILTGDSFASFLLGQVGRFTIDAQAETLKPRATVAEFFVQDDWRATRRLSLNLGVRYTLNFPSTVVDDRAAVFNLRTEQLDFLGSGGVPSNARDLERTNFAPRVGLAYRIGDSVVVRAGYGLTWIEQAGITTPFTTPLFPFVQTLGQQSLDNVSPAFVLSDGPTVRLREPSKDSGLGQGVFGVQRDNGSGYAQQWNLMLQKTVGEHWSVEAGYLGSKLTRLGVPDVNLNQLTVEQLALGAQLIERVANPFFGQIPATSSLGGATIPRAQLLRPFPRFTSVTLYRNNIGHSTYHSFQSRLEKLFSRGLTFTASYTFSRLIDDAGAVFDSAVLTGPVTNFQAADSYNKRLEKDVSTGNVPHIFSSGVVYELPWGGWQLAGIIRAQSGSPVAVTQATNWNAFAGFGVQRPNRLRDPRLASDARSTSRWFDTAAFSEARQFTIGNSSRNPVVGPSYRTLDLMVGKTFDVGERMKAEFRAEAFNVTNTPPLGNPNGTFGGAAFGTITTAGDPRVYELVMKVRF